MQVNSRADADLRNPSYSPKGYDMRFSKIAHSATLGCVALALTLALASCGGADRGGEQGGDTAGSGVDKASLIEKMKTEPDIQGIPESTVSCIADVALKYGDKKSLQGYVDGSVKSIDDVKGLGKEDKEAEQASWKCAQ
ncbi:hypothetical protein [Nonomuraea sp. NPDC003804]|uniref:hypothetical protein n=1 Tax=Nonomuraea sp. NPDC003804 TaxID=3154547 RepID=UPI0033A08278